MGWLDLGHDPELEDPPRIRSEKVNPPQPSTTTESSATETPPAPTEPSTTPTSSSATPVASSGEPCATGQPTSPPDPPEPGLGYQALVIGRKGSGKSYRARRLAERLSPWVCWDFKGEWASVSEARVWVDLADFGEHLDQGGDIHREVFKCPNAQFAPFCNFVAAAGDLTLFLEEVDRFTHAGMPPECMRDLIDRGRHLRVNLIAIAHRAQMVPKALTYSVDHVVVCGQVNEPRDIQYLREKGGPEFAELVGQQTGYEASLLE